MDQLKHGFIDGKLISLRRPTEEDALGFWYNWFNDPEVALYTGWWKPNTPNNQLDFLRSIEASNTSIVLIIEDKLSGAPIGVVSLSKINWVQGEIEHNYDFLINNLEDLMNTMDISSLFTEFFPLIDFRIGPNPNFHNDGKKETITIIDNVYLTFLVLKQNINP